MTSPSINKKTDSVSSVWQAPRWAWIAWGSASFFFAYQYLLRVIPSVMMPDIMERFSMDAKQYGQFSGIYYLGYALMQIPMGLLMDRIGPRLMMPISIGLVLLGVSPLMGAESWIWPVVGRLCVGIGSAGAIVGVFKLVDLGFPRHLFARFTGATASLGVIGALWGGVPMQGMLNSLGMDGTLEILLVSGALIIPCLWFSIPKRGRAVGTHSKNSWKDDLVLLFTNRNLWLISLCGGLMIGIIEGFADVWGTGFLMDIYGLPKEWAVGTLSTIFVGMAIGTSGLTYLASKFRATLLSIILSGVVMILAFGALLTGGLPEGALMPTMVVMGFFTAYQILIIYQATLFAPERMVGLSSSFANMVIMIFGFIFHPTIGVLLHYLTPASEARPGHEAYVFALGIILLGLVLGTLGVFLFSKTLWKRRHPA